MIFFKKDNYHVIANPDLKALDKKYADVWKDGGFPQRQWARVEKQLENIPAVPEFQAALAMVRATNLTNPSILEVGCSSGYLSEVFKSAGVKVRYEGTDYSPDFIRFAKEKYPKIKFTVNDATSLKYTRQSFDIIVSGCCLLHIIDYQKAISEAARVAKKFVIFHRTPVFHTTPTTFLTKTAYGREMLEIVFNEEELIDLFRQNNIAVVKTRALNGITISNINEKATVKSYLLGKV